jgi:hypothetical protein
MLSFESQEKNAFGSEARMRRAGARAQKTFPHGFVFVPAAAAGRARTFRALC